LFLAYGSTEFQKPWLFAFNVIFRLILSAFSIGRLVMATFS